MYHYMAAMHRRFFQAPDFAELKGEIEQAPGLPRAGGTAKADAVGGRTKSAA